MHEDLLPFTNKNVDANGIMSSAPVIKHTEFLGQNSINKDLPSDQVNLISLYKFIKV